MRNGMIHGAGYDIKYIHVLFVFMNILESYFLNFAVNMLAPKNIKQYKRAHTCTSVSPLQISWLTMRIQISITSNRCNTFTFYLPDRFIGRGSLRNSLNFCVHEYFSSYYWLNAEQVIECMCLLVLIYHLYRDLSHCVNGIIVLSNQTSLSINRQAFREFLVSPALIGNLNVHKNFGFFPC